MYINHFSLHLHSVSGEKQPDVQPQHTQPPKNISANFAQYDYNLQFYTIQLLQI